MEILLKSPTVRRHLYKKYVDTYSKELLESVCEIQQQFKSKDSSVQLKENILEVISEIIILHKKKLVSPEQFWALKRSFRLVCSSITNSFRLESIRKDLYRIIGYINKFFQEIKDIVSPYVEEPFLIQFHESLTIIGNRDFILFGYEKALPLFKNIINGLLYYLGISREDSFSQ